MICGLTPSTAGEATVLGADYRRIANPARHVGVMLDASAQHSGRRGRETLRLCAETIGADPGSASTRCSTLVGLDRTAAKRRVGKYSLGMRQRLGLAQVAARRPRRADPRRARERPRPRGHHLDASSCSADFADRGGTVLLSSHLLNEVEALADQLLLIRQGSLVASGPKDELLAGDGTLVRSPEPEALAQRARTAPGSRRRRPTDGLIAEAEPEAVGRAALAGGVPLSELRPAEGAGLEQLFLSLTSDGKRGRGHEHRRADRSLRTPFAGRASAGSRPGRWSTRDRASGCSR